MKTIYLKKKAVVHNNYRYLLQRVWNTKLDSVLFIMLNPSTADGLKDDPTIRACVRLANAWGYGGIDVVNLFAWRSTKPKKLLEAEDPVGLQNNEYIKYLLRDDRLIVCAWGNHSLANKRAKKLKKMMKKRKRVPYCLGVTKKGYPKHPLYIKSSTKPLVYNFKKSK